MGPVNNTSVKAANPGDGAAPGHLRWETAGSRTHRCDIATAGVAPEDIILNFGGALAGEHPGEVGVTMLRRIALRPLAAKHLSATLQRLIAEFDSRLNRPR